MKKWNMKGELKEKDSSGEHIIKSLLAIRGITSQEDTELFFNPQPPETLTCRDVGIDKTALKSVCVRIQKAIDEKESIVVYADYDADGITAGAVLWEALYKLGCRVMPYIPSRSEEGYGFSEKGLDAIKNDFNPTLVISVDHGITANQYIEYARRLGMEVVVTDHHLKPDKVPDCLTLHTTALSGAGIAFFLAKELLKTVIARKHEALPAGRQESLQSGNQQSTISDKTIGQLVYELLSLSAIGTIADMVPLIGPNRSLAKYGLEALNKTKRVGLIALIRNAGLVEGEITSFNVSHMIAPRLNAMGRLTHALDALRLLCTTRKDRAEELADTLGLTNKERQQMTLDSVIHAKTLVAQHYGKNMKKKILVVSHESYNQGIIGLVAGKLVEEHFRPAVVIAVGETISKASARSIPGFNIVEAIRSFQELLIDVGGHPQAAGFTIKTEHITVFQEKLEEYAQINITEDMMERTISIDLEIPLTAVDDALWEQLKKFEPYGLGNPEPVFATRGVSVSDIRRIGAEGKHLKMKIHPPSPDLRHPGIDAVQFNAPSLSPQSTQSPLPPKSPLSTLSPSAVSSTPIDIAYTIDMNQWNGKRNLQLKIKDISKV